MNFCSATVLSGFVCMVWSASEVKAAKLTMVTPETPCLFGPDAPPVEQALAKGAKKIKIGDQWFDIRETPQGHPFKDYLVRCFSFPEPITDHARVADTGLLGSRSNATTTAYQTVWQHTGLALGANKYELRRKPEKWSPRIWAKMITDHSKTLREADAILDVYESKTDELWQACKTAEPSQALGVCLKVDAHLAKSSIPSDRAAEFTLAKYYFNDRIAHALSKMESEGRLERMAAVTWPSCRDYVIKDPDTAKEAVEACDWAFRATAGGKTIVGADDAQAHLSSVKKAPNQYGERQAIETLCHNDSGHKYGLKGTISKIEKAIAMPTERRNETYGEAFRFPSNCQRKLSSLQAEEKKMAVFELPWAGKTWHCRLDRTNLEQITASANGRSLRVDHALFILIGGGYRDVQEHYSEQCEILETDRMVAKCEGSFQGRLDYRVGNAMVDVVEYYTLPKGGSPLIRQTWAGKKVLKNARCVRAKKLR